MVLVLVMVPVLVMMLVLVKTLKSGLVLDAKSFVVLVMLELGIEVGGRVRFLE